MIGPSVFVKSNCPSAPNGGYGYHTDCFPVDLLLRLTDEILNIDATQAAAG